MTAEVFWDRYMNNDILDIFDDTCEFFSQELPEGFTDEYDAIEVILEIAGHIESAKKFDKVLKFINIIQKHQPELYKKSFVYLNEFLVEYYCFHQNRSKVDEAFSLYIENPVEDYDNFLSCFKSIKFYQYSELLNRAIVESYHTVDTSSRILGGGVDLSMSKFYITLQEFFEEKKDFDKITFSAELEEYGFEFNDDFFSALKDGLSESHLSVEELKTLFAEDSVRVIIILRGYFLRYMYERGFEFYLSGHIWDKMLSFWLEDNKKRKTFDSYFRVSTDSFEEHLTAFSDMFIDNKPEMIATLWGSVYIYEFLYKLEIISIEVYHDFLKTSQKLKGNIIGIFTPDLWASNFIHHWQKPDTVSETEFNEEHKIFAKSISLGYDDFSVVREVISEELTKIGDLADYIIEGGEGMIEYDDFNMFNNLLKDNTARFDDDDDDDNEYQYYEEKHLEPIRTEPKVGRNDPCPCGSGKKYKKCCGK